METYSFYLMIAALCGLAALWLALAAKSLSDFVLDKWRHSRPCLKWGFTAAALLAALYGGTKSAGPRVNYPRTDSGTAYLTDAGSSVTNDAVTLNFTRSSLVPDDAWLFLDCYPLSITNAADVAANCVTVYSNQFSDIELPLTIPYENATNFNWIAYTDWTPGPIVHTNGVVNVAWLKVKGEMPPNAVRVVPLRTDLNVVNAETEEEYAWRVYAPDTAFEIDLSLIATNTYSLCLANQGRPWSGTSKIDWGDGTVVTNAAVGYYGVTHTHTYPEIGKYVIRVGAAPYLFYGFNASSPSKFAVTRVLRFADADQNKSTAANKYVPEFGGCVNLTAFDDGTLPRWPEGYGAIGAVYQNCTGLTATRIPEWPSTATSIGAVYFSCAGLAATRIPEWPAGATSIGGILGGTYASCTGLTATRIPEWPAGALEIRAVYTNCRNITGTIPTWPDSVTTLFAYYNYGVYSGCMGLTGTIPAWGANITAADSTYRSCAGLTGAWTDDPAELMPTNITSHAGVVAGTSAALRALFYSDWGGTREKPADE